MFVIVPMGEKIRIFNSTSEYILSLFFQCFNLIFIYIAQFGIQDLSYDFIHSL